MAKFEDAIVKTLDFEGGFDNIPEDTGGMTIQGVSRNNFPEWEGWHFIDSLIEKGLTNKQIYKECLNSSAFQELVIRWYKENFWDAVKGDEINDQRVAFNIFDFAVNAGVYRASKKAQEVVGAMADGAIGPKSVAMINAYNPTAFVSEYKSKRAQFYQAIVDNNPSQRVFLNGWLNRVEQC